MNFNAIKARELVDASPFKEKVIADRCTIKVKSLQQYLRGNGTPSPSVLRLLAQTLGVSESELTSGDKEAPKASEN